MKTAAGVVAVLAWGGLLAAMWYPLVAGVRPPLGAWLGVIFASLFVGLIVPALLLGMDGKPPASTRPRPRHSDWPQWRTRTTTRTERPTSSPKRDE